MVVFYHTGLESKMTIIVLFFFPRKFEYAQNVDLTEKNITQHGNYTWRGGSVMFQAPLVYSPGIAASPFPCLDVISSTNLQHVCNLQRKNHLHEKWLLRNFLIVKNGWIFKWLAQNLLLWYLGPSYSIFYPIEHSGMRLVWRFWSLLNNSSQAVWFEKWLIIQFNWC